MRILRWWESKPVIRKSRLDKDGNDVGCEYEYEECEFRLQRSLQFSNFDVYLLVGLAVLAAVAIWMYIPK
jgi:hypothetical protein